MKMHREADPEYGHVYIASGLVRYGDEGYRSFGWGTTPTAARLDFLHNIGRRRCKDCKGKK